MRRCVNDHHAQPTPSSAAASTHGAATPSLELLEARQLRDALKLLLRKEQAAMADFLVALADFDRRRGWEALGPRQPLRLPARRAAALQRARPTGGSARPRACSSASPRLDRAAARRPALPLHHRPSWPRSLTEENRAEVLPRFFGLSAREAQEIVAELQPREAPATRTVVTGAGAGWSRRPAPRCQPPPRRPSARLPWRSRPSPADRRCTAQHADPGHSQRSGARSGIRPSPHGSSPRATTSSRSPPTCAGSTSPSAGSSCRSSRPPGTGSPTPSRAPPWSRCSRRRSTCCWRSRPGRAGR